jgi:hypothetical protein
MTHKTAFEIVVPTVADALAIPLSVVAVYLTDKYLDPIEQAEAHAFRRGSVDR